MKKVFHKVWEIIRYGILYFFYGMKSADDVVMGGGNDDMDGGIGKEVKQQNEHHKVCQDLLRGEITEEVMELRHEMYYTERESKKYEYSGGGRAKMKSIFGYKGDIENSEGLKVLLVQENREDTGGIFSDLNPNKERTFTLDIERAFLPTSKIEEYCRKIVVRDLKNGFLKMDLYFDNYVRQFDRRNRIFVNELGRILEGDRRSELLDFNSVSFITRNAYGSDDNIRFKYADFTFCEAFTYKGSVVLRFMCKGGREEDLLDSIYHEETARKIKEKAPRKENESTVSFTSAMGDGYDTENAVKAIREEMEEDD